MAVATLPQLPMGSRSVAPSYCRELESSPTRNQSQAWAGYDASNDYVTDHSAGMPSAVVFKKNYTLPL